MLLARKGKKQIMGKEDQLNPFQLNCAGEVGGNDIKLKSVKFLALQKKLFQTANIC